MKQQTKLAVIGDVRRESDGATIKVRTHVNKGKQYPYASERQNTRYALCPVCGGSDPDCKN